MGKMITFHSSKGGSGRTMAVANIAVLLAQWGYKTLVMDWDLESPGLGIYFEQRVPLQWREKPGVLDLLTHQQDTALFTFGQPEWKPLRSSIKVNPNGNSLDFIGPGVMDDTYFRRLTKLDLAEFYRKNGGLIIETLREQWKHAYDFILVDCRSGVTEVSGISTIQLPDILVVFFTANKQSLQGATSIVMKAMTSRERFPVERTALSAVPILSKVDLPPDSEMFRQCLSQAESEVKSMYSNWLPASINTTDFLDRTKIPYYSEYSFGERLSVLEERIDGTSTLTFAYAILAGLLARELVAPEEILTSPEHFVKKSSKTEKLAGLRNTKPQVFLSYAREDLEQVRKIYEGLTTRGVNVWFDKERIRRGRWKPQIEKAIARSRFFIICVSEHALRKTGDEATFQDDELNIAVSIAREQPESSFTIVPVRLEECGYGDHRISGFQNYDAFQDFEEDMNKLAAALL